MYGYFTAFSYGAHGPPYTTTQREGDFPLRLRMSEFLSRDVRICIIFVTAFPVPVF